MQQKEWNEHSNVDSYPREVGTSIWSICTTKEQVAFVFTLWFFLFLSHHFSMWSNDALPCRSAFIFISDHSTLIMLNLQRKQDKQVNMLTWAKSTLVY